MMLRKVSKTDEETRKGRLIPSGELKCVWMTAGVVSYKLCNHGYECETCPFDQSMRRQDERASDDPQPLDEAAYRKISSGSFPCRGKPDCGNEETPWEWLRDFHNIRIQKTYLYHRGHTWADISNRDVVNMGIDDFAATCLPEVKTIILPAQRNRIDQGQICCWIATEDGTIPILSPLTGTVLDANPWLARQQDLMRKAPYEQGWLMHIEPEELDRDLQHLYDEEKACSACQEDIEKLRETFWSALSPPTDQLGPTLHDGGLTLVHLRDMVGAKRYFKIISSFFTAHQK